ncbi:hypothetical protein FJ527_25270 [Mesorhizobium sp. B2-4-18]|nr:hypothetical protein FJ527_25270 [Mesorhizobium sp. B2-4-18]
MTLKTSRFIAGNRSCCDAIGVPRDDPEPEAVALRALNFFKMECAAPPSWPLAQARSPKVAGTTIGSASG